MIYFYPMNPHLYQQIENSTAHRKIREDICNLALADDKMLKTLFQTALDPKDKNHFKACWILELVLEEKLILIIPYLEIFCQTLTEYKSDQAIRSISKICLFLSDSKTVILTENQEEKIIEICLDWLIEDKKVASKAYSMRTLFNFGKKHDWIYYELKPILEQDYAHHSAAYKAAAKDVLRKISKEI